MDEERDSYDNIDDLVAAMERDELEDAEWLKPRDFAKLIGVAPQLVYYYIRNGRIVSQQCLCGNKVINKKQAKMVFDTRGSVLSKEADEADE